MVTIMVTNVGLDNAYDADDDGEIGESEITRGSGTFLCRPASTHDGRDAQIGRYLLLQLQLD